MHKTNIELYLVVSPKFPANSSSMCLESSQHFILKVHKSSFIAFFCYLKELTLSKSVLFLDLKVTYQTEREYLCWTVYILFVPFHHINLISSKLSEPTKPETAPFLLSLRFIINLSSSGSNKKQINAIICFSKISNDEDVGYLKDFQLLVVNLTSTIIVRKI